MSNQQRLAYWIEKRSLIATLKRDSSLISERTRFDVELAEIDGLIAHYKAMVHTGLSSHLS